MVRFSTKVFNDFSWVKAGVKSNALFAILKISNRKTKIQKKQLLRVAFGLFF